MIKDEIEQLDKEFLDIVPDSLVKKMITDNSINNSFRDQIEKQGFDLIHNGARTFSIYSKESYPYLIGVMTYYWIQPINTA